MKKKIVILTSNGLPEIFYEGYEVFLKKSQPNLQIIVKETAGVSTQEILDLIKKEENELCHIEIINFASEVYSTLLKCINGEKLKKETDYLTELLLRHKPDVGYKRELINNNLFLSTVIQIFC